MQPVPLARVVRSDLEESVHLGHVAVCDADGRLVAHAGDASHAVFARSCMKPLQAAVSLQAIGETQPDREVAVMCASHNGEPTHLAAVRAVLRRAGLDADVAPDPSGLSARSRRHGASPPSNPAVPQLFRQARRHAAGVRPIGLERTSTYRNRSHPLQRRVASAVRTGTGVQDP